VLCDGSVITKQQSGIHIPCGLLYWTEALSLHGVAVGSVMAMAANSVDTNSLELRAQSDVERVISPTRVT
jgi:hypothetical protein